MEVGTVIRIPQTDEWHGNLRDPVMDSQLAREAGVENGLTGSTL